MRIEVQWKAKRVQKNAVFTRKKPGLSTMSALRRATAGIPNTSMNCGLADGLGKQHKLDGGDLGDKVLGKELLMPVFGCVGAGCTSQQPAVSKAG